MDKVSPSFHVQFQLNGFMMSIVTNRTRSLLPVALSTACALALTSCSAVDTLRNSMPTGYSYNSTKPISAPKKTVPYDADIKYNQADIDKDFMFHKDKVDQLLEQITPNLRTIPSGEKVFLVSEQKNKDFDDALRLGLRNMGIGLDLTSMARYQMIYTIRDAKKKDFEHMSIKPTAKDIKGFDYYALNVVDTLHGQPIADAYLIPGYHGFKVPQGYTAVHTEVEDHTTTHEAAYGNVQRAQPVMDDSPMLTAPEDVIDTHEDITAPVESYGTAYSEGETSNAAPMPITVEAQQ